jgi:hypothetical protein
MPQTSRAWHQDNRVYVYAVNKEDKANPKSTFRQAGVGIDILRDRAKLSAEGFDTTANLEYVSPVQRG